MNSSIASRKHVALSAALAMLLGACSSSGETAAGESGPQAVRVIADDASWETSGISDLRAGWVSFTMETREGEADHGLGLLRLQGDATVEELVQAESFEQFLELAEPIGGLVGVTGAATHTVTAHLDPGPYAIIDFGETEEGPNFLRGMTASFDVASGEEVAGVQPSSDGEIVMREFAIDVPEGFAGHGTYLVRNAGGLFHELNIARFPAGVDAVEEIGRHAETGRGRMTEVPGMWLLAPDGEAYLELDLDPGSHALICFLSDPEDQPAHAEQGMYTLFTVD